jgi:hypothetical protein
MAISVACPCGATYRVADHFAGKKISCECGLSVDVPSPYDARDPATLRTTRREEAPAPRTAPPLGGPGTAVGTVARGRGLPWVWLVGGGCGVTVLVGLFLLLGGAVLLAVRPPPVASLPAAGEAGGSGGHDAPFAGDDEFEPFPDGAEARKPGSATALIVVSRKGDARQRLTLALNEQDYTDFKAVANPVSAVRRLGFGKKHWLEIQDLKVETDDARRTVTIGYTTRGMARLVGDGAWEIAREGVREWEPIGGHDNEALFDASTETRTGMLRMTVHVVVPRGGRGLKLSPGQERLTYELPDRGGLDAGGAAPELTVDVQPQLMACLGKLYGDRKFADMWVARAVLRNAGGGRLHDYQVRFRLPEYTRDWSPLRRAPVVLPGQTVVDPYYPALDLERLVKTDGTREVRVEVEYGYRLPGGGRVERTESRPLTLLNRNTLVYSSLRREDQLDSFYDRFDNTPVLLASLVSHTDPEIQRVAGWVSDLAGGGSFSSDPEAALGFLKALFEFMAANLSYQTPPGDTIDGVFTQHVKYGRDVLRNRAGTCIDLAIFYASVCQAVGLDPVLYVIPGHCFPAVKVPGRRDAVWAVETTLIRKANFIHALNLGKDDMARAKKGPSYAIDVKQVQAKGVFGLDLSPLGGTAMEWGIVKERARVANVIPPPEYGTWWKSSGEVEGTLCDVFIRLKDQDTWQMAIVKKRTQEAVNHSGKYAYDSDTGEMVLCDGGGTPIQKGKIVWKDGDTFAFALEKDIAHENQDIEGKVRIYKRDPRPELRGANGS